MLCDITVYSAYATVLEGDVSNAKRKRHQSSFWKKKIEETVRGNFGWSGEKRESSSTRAGVQLATQVEEPECREGVRDTKLQF